jgi:hypothetical protein
MREVAKIRKHFLSVMLEEWKHVFTVATINRGERIHASSLAFFHWERMCLAPRARLILSLGQRPRGKVVSEKTSSEGANQRSGCPTGSSSPRR